MSGNQSVWMAETELTNEQFRQFKPDHDSRAIDQQWKDHIYAGYPANGPQQSVIRIGWNEAMAFCSWLSDKTGKSITLPTEEQWEWACRAGSAEPFSFGSNPFSNYATIGDLAVRGIDPKPIGARSRSPLNDFVPRDDSVNDGQLVPKGTAMYKPNAWGLYDMHGNVAEYTQSDFDENRAWRLLARSPGTGHG